MEQNDFSCWKEMTEEHEATTQYKLISIKIISLKGYSKALAGFSGSSYKLTKTAKQSNRN